MKQLGVSSLDDSKAAQRVRNKAVGPLRLLLLVRLSPLMFSFRSVLCSLKLSVAL